MSDLHGAEGFGAFDDPGKAQPIRVEFYRNPVDGLDHLRADIPGDKTFKPDYVVTEYYKRQYAREWEAYQAGQSQLSGMTLLGDLAWIDEGTRAVLIACSVPTLEHLAGMSDASMSAVPLPGIRDLRERAIKVLAEKSKAAEYDKVRAENADLRARIEALEKGHVGQPAAAPAKRGPGRPRKEQAAA